MPARALARIAACAAALAVVAAGCGSSGSGAQQASASAAPTVIATPRLTADDAPVAWVTVNRLRMIDALRRKHLLSSETCEVRAQEDVTITVWASCVAAQARTIPTGSDEERRAAARDQCIAFELLAQVAEACGLAAAPEVVEAARTAAVNRMIETEFEQRYRTPDDLKPAVDAVMQRNEWRMHVPELRSSTFARFVVPKDASPELDAKAHALADRVAAQLAGEHGLYSVHLVEAAQRVAAGGAIKLEHGDVKPSDRDHLVDAYAAALYAIPEVGRIAPAVRTQWGWDVVLWTGGIEARERPRDEVVAEAFPELRRHQFQLWVSQLGKQLGVRVEVDQAGVAELDTGDSP